MSPLVWAEASEAFAPAVLVALLPRTEAVARSAVARISEVGDDRAPAADVEEEDDDAEPLGREDPTPAAAWRGVVAVVSCVSVVVVELLELELLELLEVEVLVLVELEVLVLEEVVLVLVLVLEVVELLADVV